jgi:hypothetical protein
MDRDRNIRLPSFQPVVWTSLPIVSIETLLQEAFANPADQSCVLDEGEMTHTVS